MKDEAFTEPDVKRKKIDTEDSKKSIEKISEKDAEKDSKENEKKSLNADGGTEQKETEQIETEQKGGWKILGDDGKKKETSIETKEVKSPKKIPIGAGFGFGGPPRRYGMIKTSALAAKPSLFAEESKPEKKLDMFSIDSEDDHKDKDKSVAEDQQSKVCLFLPHPAFSSRLSLVVIAPKSFFS